jgi:hypothetical protein
MPEPGRGRTQGQRVHAGRRTPALLYGAGRSLGLILRERGVALSGGARPIICSILLKEDD